jgi:hypothetical protein
MKIKLFLSLMFASLMIMSACKKDKSVQSNKDFISGKDCWRLVKFESKNSDGSYTDISDQVLSQDPCNMDDCYRFYKEGNFEQNEGATKCNPDDAQVYTTGTWSLSSDNVISISSNAGTDTYNVEKASSSQLIFSGNINRGGFSGLAHLVFQ